MKLGENEAVNLEMVQSRDVALQTEKQLAIDYNWGETT